MRSTFKYIASSFIWGSIAKILNAGLKFISIPLLLAYFGKENYGLLTLAIAANAYMHLLDMGINTGAVKFFSQWLAVKDYGRVDRVFRTNLTIYIILGIINTLLLILLACFGESVFNITSEEFYTFRYLLYILAATSVINWAMLTFNQLLVADERMAFTQQVLTVRSILNLLIVFITIKLKWSLIDYFLCDTLIGAAVIIPYIVACKKNNLIKRILPGFFWNDFVVVFKYSIAIFAMSLFQFTATQSRPLILGIFSSEGASILSDYRVIEVFPIFIISLGGIFTSILLPKTARLIQQNDKDKVEKMAYEGTRYTSILIAILCFPIILNAADLLTLYVGESYKHLAVWLSLWVFSLTLFLHNTPIASLVLATGKTRMLVYSSAIACIVSMFLNAILCKYFGVGSAVIGYLIYIIIQMSFYYFYFNNKILLLNSWRVFKSFAIPTILGFLIAGLINISGIGATNIYMQIIMKVGLWLFFYILLIFLLKIIKWEDVKRIIKK